MIILLDHLPLLQVLIPLFTAPICVLIRNYVVLLFLVGVATVLNIIITVAIIIKIQSVHTISYAFGSWLPPIGIEYRIDHLSSLLLVIITTVAFFAFLHSINCIKNKIPDKQISLFYALFLLSIAGFTGMVVTNDLFNMYVFLEIASLASYGLVALGDDKALIAAIQYLILGSIAALFILFGIGLLYMMTGTLNMTDLFQKLIHKIELVPVKYGIIFMVTGVLLKMAFFPMHLWLANIYAYAPPSVGVLLSGITSKISLYMLLRIIFNIIGVDQFYSNFSALISCLKMMSYMAIIFGGIFAILSTNIRKTLAFSTISQLGYMVIVIVDIRNIEPLFLLMIAHSLSKMTLLMFQDKEEHSYKGFTTNICVAFNIASLIGIPITLGFSAKWVLLSSLSQEGAWYSFIVIVIGSILTALYGWKIVKSNITKSYTIVFATILNFILALNSKSLIIYSKLIASNLLKGYL
ncbi:Na(+)/H(+) antiporter subunit D [Rickettsiales bacterium Ac37b]|nr:Na(+)/H(+) antiporter subunit D [Rickettsiales bacterium Ac37b]